MNEPESQPPGSRVVAAFDFDGTLTRRDTLVLFFAELCGWLGLGKALFAELVSVLAGGVLGNHHRDRARAVLTHRLLGGHREEDVLTVACRLADRIFAQELRPDTCAWLSWHQSQGHEVVVISASFAAYVEPVARRLGADAVLATRWEVQDGTCLTGDLAGPNVRGPEKAIRLREYLQGGDAFVYAYGNSAGDRDLLDAAARRTRVRRYQRLPSPPASAGT